MTREELQDMVLDTRKALTFYENIETKCVTCEKLVNTQCKIHGDVPADFATTINDCANWSFDDVPF
jgi:hypothetical protein